MLYLSQLVVNPRSPHVRGDLADCRALHRRVLHAFPDSDDITAAREHFGVLYRLEPFSGGARVLVQSRELPDWSRLPADYLRGLASKPKRVDELYERIVQGQVLRFRLRANPTKRVSARATELNSPTAIGKRVELRAEADQLQWLTRKGEASGFVLLRADVAHQSIPEIVPDDAQASVVDVRIASTAAKVRHYLPSRKLDLAFGSVVFDGLLRVTDAEPFHRALHTGIGSGKAFGFGLLSVAPVGSIGS